MDLSGLHSTRIPFSSTSPSIGITRHLRPSIMRVSTRSARSGSTWTTTSGVLISNLFVLVMLEATREDFSPAVISYCSSNDCSFSSSTPHSSKRRFTSDLVRTTGSGSSFCDSIRSFNFSWMLNTVSYLQSSPRVSSTSALKESRCPPAERGAVHPSSSSIKISRSSFAFLL